ncbi:hypothetical protein PVL29_026052 [Vitis rotundifolia]|uniref:Uncharacterized protein n=1 Tax=Vitis rotundifolia TaxID=103349 RepID=A0AA38YLL2_VITRO|nr:hypothetical protein PVL29_026052 [Vitis rotundifolia]
MLSNTCSSNCCYKCSHDLGNTLRLSLTYSMFWNFWKDEVVNLLGYLNGAIRKYADYKKFCLNYLGMLKQSNYRTPLYFVLYLEAD